MNATNENQMLGYAAASEHKTNHILHLILTLITAGAWSFIWLIVASGTITKRNKIKKKYGLPTETNTPKILLWINFITWAIIIYALVSASKSHAGLYQRQPIKSVDEAKDKVLQSVKSYSHDPQDTCYPYGQYMFMDETIDYPPEQCLKDAESFTTQEKKEEYAKDQARLKEKEATKQREATEQAEAEQKQKQKLQALVSDLKSGKKKPSNLKQAMLAYDANDGSSLAGSPKIRADGALYAIYGTIAFANEDDSFAASFKDGANQFDVKIPPELKEEYLSTAQVGGDFIVVGRYIENKQYTTVSGATKSLPSFEAIYFKMELNKAIKAQIAQCWLELSEVFRASDFAKEHRSRTGSNVPITDSMIDEWEEDCTNKLKTTSN